MLRKKVNSAYCIVTKTMVFHYKHVTHATYDPNETNKVTDSTW